MVCAMNDPNPAYFVPPLRDYHAPAGNRRTSSSPALRSWLRRTVVGGALAAGDLLVGLSILRVSAFFLAEHSHYQTLGNSARVGAALLIIILWAAGLYTGIGPSPCERLRLRTLGVLAFSAIRTMWAIHTDTYAAVYPWFAVEFLLLVVAGHYVELYVRGWLERQGVLGAPTVIIGAGSAVEAVYQALANEPTLGLRPIGFLHLPVEGTRSLSPHQFRSISDHLDVTEPPEVAVIASNRELCDPENYFSMLTGPKKVLMVMVGEHLQSLYAPMRTLGTRRKRRPPSSMVPDCV